MAGIQFNCAHCGASFQTYKCWLDKGKGHGRYCSRSCAAIARPRPPPTCPQGPLTHERLKTLLHCDPEVGVFTWQVSRGKAKAGSLAGCIDNGYVAIILDRHKYLAHRLVWFWVHGQWPKGDTDHRDGNRSNNRIANLRDVPRHMNLQNRSKANSRSTTGLLGAHWNENVGCYQSAIRSNGKAHYLGSFDTPEAAHDAYMQAKRRLHEGFVEPS